MKKQILGLFIMLIAFGSTFAQEHEIKDIYKRGFKGAKSIFDKTTNEVAGHYVYYASGNNLIIEFFDTDLNPTAKTSIGINANSEVREGIYNGENFMFMVTTSGIATMYTLKPNGERISERTYSFSTEMQADIFPSNDDSRFYIVTPDYQGVHAGYQVRKVDANFNEDWTYSFVPERGYTVVEAAQSGNDRLVIIQRNTPRLIALFKEKAFADVVVFDAANGDKLFTSPLFDGEFTAVPDQILIDEEQNIVVAGAYFKGQRMGNANSDGIFFKKLSSTGDEIAYSKSSWKDGIQKQLKRTKGKVSLAGKPKTYYHSLVQGADGGYQVIAETFSTKMNAAALGSKESSMTKMLNMKNFTAAVTSGRFVGEPDTDETPRTLQVMDLLIFDFDNVGALTGINKIEKPYTKVYVYPPYTSLSGMKLSKVVASYGFFDFAGMQKLADSDQEVVLTNAAYAKKPYVGATKIEKDVEAETKQIPFKELTGKRGSGKRDQSGACPGKPGKMLVYYFVKDPKVKGEKRPKTGTLTMYLEEVTF